MIGAIRQSLFRCENKDLLDRLTDGSHSERDEQVLRSVQ